MKLKLFNKAGLQVISAIIAIVMSVVLIITLAGCGAGCTPGEDGPPVGEEGEGEVITEAPDCDAGDLAFVESATLSILGRRPLSHDESQLGVDRIAELEAATPGQGRRLWSLELMGTPGFVGRWSELLMDDLYVPRTGIQAMGECWGESNLTSTGDPASGETALAEFVLDHTAAEGDFGEEFTFRDLLQQSVIIDDVSPAYRAHLYAMLTRLNGCNNVDFVQQELAFRDEVGHTFEAAYLNRDPVCLACHTTSFAVTDNDDPALDRHWPLKGRFEDSVFGDSGVEDPRVIRAMFRVDGFVEGGGFGLADSLDGSVAFCIDPAGTKTPAFCGGSQPLCGDGTGTDCLSPLDTPSCVADENGDNQAVCDNTPYCADQAFQNFVPVTCDGDAPACADPEMFFACGNFEVEPVCNGGVATCPAFEAPVDGGGEGAFFTPWGADKVCGSFARDLTADDPAEINALFATVSGQRATVLELEASLKRGIDSLAESGLVVDADNAIADRDQAFAYLVAMNIVDNTWKELVGAPLTIADHFPRNQAQRDQLQLLTDRFVASHFSLKSLVADIVTSELSNIQAPEAGCAGAGVTGDAAAFSYPPIFDPWVRDEPEALRRNNSAADAVHALSARTLLSAAYAALGWPAPANQGFPEGAVTADLDFTCFDTYPDCTALDDACADGECCQEKAAACGVTDGPLTEAEIQRGIGVFHGISEKGFRGLDFQARLFFESRFGSCQKPLGVGDDAIDDLLARGQDASTSDVVLALKERLTHDTTLDAGEQEVLEGLFGAFDGRAGDVADLEGKLRTLCGALLASPQFQLTGIGGPTSTPAPLQPSRAVICEGALPGCG